MREEERKREEERERARELSLLQTPAVTGPEPDTQSKFPVWVAGTHLSRNTVCQGWSQEPALCIEIKMWNIDMVICLFNSYLNKVLIYCPFF